MNILSMQSNVLANICDWLCANIIMTHMTRCSKRKKLLWQESLTKSSSTAEHGTTLKRLLQECHKEYNNAPRVLACFSTRI